MDGITLIVLVPLSLVCSFQLYYLAMSFGLALRRVPTAEQAAAAGRTLSIIIPARQAADTIGSVLDAILLNDLESIERLVVVLDRCADATQKIVESYISTFAARQVLLRVRHVASGDGGKVATLLTGLREIFSADVLLVDADVILAPTAITEIGTFHATANTPFSSCLVLPHQTPGKVNRLVDQIICNNRLYRQSILQLVKDRHGAANFPGGFQLVNAKSYSELLVHGFLEDLTATYAVLAMGGRIAILPRALAFEIERQTLYGLFLQRLRWTLGALQHLPLQIQVANQQRTFRRWVLVNSYHIMWELQHYVIVGGALLSPMLPHGGIMIVPLLIYAAQVGRSAYLTRHEYRNSLLGILLHILIFPIVITAALIASLFLLVWKRRFFFDTFLLFKRL